MIEKTTKGNSPFFKGLDLVKIGIDPAFRKNGFVAAIWDKSDNTMDFKAFGDYNEFLFWLISEDAPEKAKVIIENSNLQNTNFDIRGNKFEVARKGRNVGTNQAVSQLTVWACQTKYGKKNVKEVSPRQKGAKWNDSNFKSVIRQEKINLLSKVSNQDCRDAAKLALMKVF